MILKLNIALALEAFVLLSALFFLIYVNKNQLSKWYRYAGIAIIVFIIGLMLCTMCAGCKMCHHGGEGSEMEGRHHMKMMYMDREMQEGCCDEMMEGCERGGMDCERRNMRMHHRSHGRNMEGCCEEMGRGDCCEGGGGECEEGNGTCEMDGKGECKMKGKGECKSGMKKDTIIRKEVVIKK